MIESAESSHLINNKENLKQIFDRRESGMVTVFTPVYNRAYIISQLYQSLLRQTNNNFEWLIIDDGSTDNIIELVNQWISSTEKFQIKFYQQSNGGKHRAINRGVHLAQGDAFLIVDSDDYLTDDAVDTVLKYWKQIKDDRTFAGISGLRIHQNMQVIGGKPNFDEYVDATNLERTEYGLKGDKAEIYKTDILKAFPFPEFEGEHFVTESIVWNKIAYQGYKLRWFNKGIVICEYLEDGLSANGDRLFAQNPKGWAAYLCNEKIYQVWNEHDYLKQCLHYYETEHLYIKEDDIKKSLGIDNNKMDTIKKTYALLKRQLAELCKDKKVCIYAYGVWGKRLNRYLDVLNIPVYYIIDQKCVNTGGIVQYKLEAVLPEADVVLVALKNGSDYVIPILKSKLNKCRIVALKEIVSEWW